MEIHNNICYPLEKGGDIIMDLFLFSEIMPCGLIEFLFGLFK